jgi:hypothetical protein
MARTTLKIETAQNSCPGTVFDAESNGVDRFVIRLSVLSQFAFEIWKNEKFWDF